MILQILNPELHWRQFISRRPGLPETLAYYDRAALNCVNAVLKKDANNFEALTFKAMIYLSQHHFAEGLKLATQILKSYSYNAFVYGILVDANVELGKLQSGTR